MRSTYLASILIIVYSVLYTYVPLWVPIHAFVLLTISLISLSFFAVIWVHILLSSTYKTGALVEQVNIELDQFRSKLMVSYNIR